MAPEGFPNFSTVAAAWDSQFPHGEVRESESVYR